MLRLILLLYLIASPFTSPRTAPTKIGGGWDPNGSTSTGDLHGNLDPDGSASSGDLTGNLDPNG